MGGFAWGVGTFGRIWGYVPRLGRVVQFTTPAQPASTPTTSHLRSVAAIREDMALAVGDGGTAWLWRGAPHEPRFWHPSERVDSPWARHPSQAARRSINDTMWGSLSAHSTQRQGWVPMQVPDGARLANLTCVRFGRTGDAWAVGTGGVVLRLQYNTVQLAAGESVTTYAWEQLESPTSRSLRGVWVGPPTTMSSEHRVVIVGDAATHWTWRGDGSGGSLASGAPAEWDMSGSWTQTAVDVGTFRPGVNPSSVHFTAVTGPDGSFVGATHGLFLQLAYGSWRTVNDGMLHPNATVTSALVDVRRETLLTTDTGHVCVLVLTFCGCEALRVFAHVCGCVCVCVCVYWQVPRLLRILPLQRHDCILYPCQVLPCHTSAIHRHACAGPLRCHSCHTRHQQVVWVWRLASSRGLRDGTVRWHSRTARPCCGHSGRLRCSAWLVEGCTTRWRL